MNALKRMILGKAKRSNSNEFLVEDHADIADFDAKYSVVETLGVGGFGEVVLAQERKTGEKVAVKTVRLSGDGEVDASRSEILLHEINILRTLDHPNVVRLHEVYRSKDEVKVTMDYCDGGHLDSYAREVLSPMTVAEREPLVAYLVQQVLMGINYLHLQNVVHRDLKLENVMVVPTPAGPRIQLIDFGLSTRLSLNAKTYVNLVGTPVTLAPEQTSTTGYTNKVDLWNVGVITFTLLFDRLPIPYNPLQAGAREKLLKAIRNCEVDYDFPEYSEASANVRDFLEALLVKKAKDRLDAAAALHHPFFAEANNMVREVEDDEHQRDLVSKMFRYRKHNKLHRAALALVAHSASPSDVQEVHNLFSMMDKDKSGTVTLAEFKEAFASMGFTDGDNAEERPEVTDLFNAIDIDCTGTITYTEFLAASVETLNLVSKKKINDVFHRLDTKGTGMIDVKQIRKALGQHNVSTKDFAAIIEDMHKTGREFNGTQLDRKLFKHMCLDELKEMQDVPDM